MRRWLVAFLSGAVVVAWMQTAPTQALSLEIRPLEYRTSLDKGEKQKGFIDVTNPTSENIHIRTEVQAFRQVDDRGSLQFYDSEKVAAGIIPDLEEFDLGSRETLRMYFLLDGTKLANGDNFGALFFRIISTETTGVNGSLRLGTLFSIQNATPTDHRAEVSAFDVPFLQLGDTVSGTYSITNTADPNTTNAFYPQVQFTIAPFKQTKTHTSGLVFAGRTRTNEFSIETLRFGFYTLTLEHNGVAGTRLIFVATPWQLVIAGLFVVALGLGSYLLWRRRQTTRTLHPQVSKRSKKQPK